MENETLKSAEIRVAGFNELTAEQGRALYAAYTSRGLEIERLTLELEFVAARLHTVYRNEDGVSEPNRKLLQALNERARDALAATARPVREGDDNA